ncbi:MAG: helix-turn-helix domain-containing protein [Aestuariibacter sp.]|nr:helix-turn-helix domain-containing protein [Aestuariibacter sp.]
MNTAQINPLEMYKQLNTQEAASFLGVTPRHMEQLRQRKEGPQFIKMSPRCVRYRVQDLINFQESRIRSAT